jgi:AhpD family alkylhydroperoxidase
MARVEGQENVVTRAANWYVKRTYGRPIGITSVIAQTPWNMVGWGTLEFGHDRSQKAEERLKALAEIKAATTAGCQFCIDIGTALGRKAGVTEDQIRDFHHYRESDAFSPLEKLVLEYAEAMTATPVNVPDELFAQLREHLDDAAIVDLTAGIAIENFRARFNNALDIPPAGFSEGMSCPLPDHVAAARANGTEAAQPGRAIA